MCLGNISINFTVNTMKKTGLKRHVHTFSVDYNIIGTNDILDIHKYLMKITINNVWLYFKKVMLGFVKKNV